MTLASPILLSSYLPDEPLFDQDDEDLYLVEDSSPDPDSDPAFDPDDPGPDESDINDLSPDDENDPDFSEETEDDD